MVARELGFVYHGRHFRGRLSMDQRPSVVVRFHVVERNDEGDCR